MSAPKKFAELVEFRQMKDPLRLDVIIRANVRFAAEIRIPREDMERSGAGEFIMSELVNKLHRHILDLVIYDDEGEAAPYAD